MCEEEKDDVSDFYADVTDDSILLQAGINRVTGERYMSMSESELDTARLLHVNMSVHHASSSSAGIGSLLGSHSRIPQVISRSAEASHSTGYGALTESIPLALHDAPVATEIFDMEAGEEPVHEDSLQDTYDCDWTGPLPTYGSTVVDGEVPEEVEQEEALIEYGGSTTGATEYYEAAETGEETAHGSTVAVFELHQDPGPSLADDSRPQRGAFAPGIARAPSLQ